MQPNLPSITPTTPAITDPNVQAVASQMGVLPSSSNATDPRLQEVAQGLGVGASPSSSMPTSEPSDVQKASTDEGDQSYDGWCESFVEAATGMPKQGGTALEAWQNNLQKGTGVQGLDGIQPGDPMYFSDPNQPDGHTGIYMGGNRFISATDNGVAVNDLDKWMSDTGQTPLGYISMGGKNGSN